MERPFACPQIGLFSQVSSFSVSLWPQCRAFVRKVPFSCWRKEQVKSLKMCHRCFCSKVKGNSCEGLLSVPFLYFNNVPLNYNDRLLKHVMHFLHFLWGALLLQEQPEIMQETTSPGIDYISDRALWCSLPGEALPALMDSLALGAAARSFNKL